MWAQFALSLTSVRRCSHNPEPTRGYERFAGGVRQDKRQCTSFIQQRVKARQHLIAQLNV
ncbi:hypothetical protein [Sodalis sp.]|uniref:hypothetical protein n=1 Tax=Sodalis sp. (in: enterobacteria) TaxID=1898979 RepID=UPI0038738230